MAPFYQDRGPLVFQLKYCHVSLLLNKVYYYYYYYYYYYKERFLHSPIHYYTCTTGVDPGFFLGGGAPLRNGVTNVVFFGEYQLY